MAKAWQTFDHTADIGLAATADTLGELLEAMGEGLAELICPRRQVAATLVRRVRVEAEDREALAVDFLWQVMSAIQVDHFVVASVWVRDVDDTHVTAKLIGEPYDPARHELAAEVKAVTYHQISIVKEGSQWAARVILDV